MRNASDNDPKRNASSNPEARIRLTQATSGAAVGAVAGAMAVGAMGPVGLVAGVAVSVVGTAIGAAAAPIVSEYFERSRNRRS